MVALLYVLRLIDAVSGISSTVVSIVLVVGLTLGVLGYPAASETLFRGRTVGKAVMGLRVRTVEGGPVRFRHAAIRSMVGLVDFFVPPIGTTAVIAALSSPRSQRLGDMVAGTVVLHERLPARDPGAVWFAAPRGWERYAAALDVSALTVRQQLLVRSFLLRSADLTPAARATVGGELVRRVAGRLGVLPPPGMVGETFLACVCAAYQQRDANRP